jgi:hypothetical protein
VGERKPLIWKDPKTDLEWQFDSPGEMTWQTALEYADSLSLDGKRDWRLPSLSDLETLLDRSVLYYKLRPRWCLRTQLLQEQRLPRSLR